MSFLSHKASQKKLGRVTKYPALFFCKCTDFIAAKVGLHQSLIPLQVSIECYDFFLPMSPTIFQYIAIKNNMGINPVKKPAISSIELWAFICSLELATNPTEMIAAV